MHLSHVFNATLLLLSSLVSAQQAVRKTCYPKGPERPDSKHCAGAIAELLQSSGAFTSVGAGECSTEAEIGNCAVSLCGGRGGFISRESIAVAAQIVFASCKNGGYAAGHISLEGFASGYDGLTAETVGVVVSKKEAAMKIWQTGKGNKRRALTRAPRRLHNLSPTELEANATAGLVPTPVGKRNDPWRYQPPPSPRATFTVRGRRQYTLAVMAEENTGRPITHNVATDLDTRMYVNWLEREASTGVILGRAEMGAFSPWMGYFAEDNQNAGEITHGNDHADDDWIALLRAVQDFRNQRGNPAWFSVRVFKGNDGVRGTAVGWFVFDMGPGPLL